MFDFFRKRYKTQLRIEPYRGFVNETHLYVHGRVLDNAGIFSKKKQSLWRNAKDSIRRINTDEVADVRVILSVHGQIFESQTDREGYFTVDSPWQAPLNVPQNRWILAHVELLDMGIDISATLELFYPCESASYGLITDVDDTVLATHVTAPFRIKTAFATLMQNAHQRQAMKGMVELFQSFENGKNGKNQNPVFYVSHSPWNLYDLLLDFFQIKKYPKGPILLRDYGIWPVGDFSGHKIQSMKRILEMYPHLPFILFGDTAAKDADFYLEIAKIYPNRIKAIYIRNTKNNRNARRIKGIIDKSEAPILMIHKSSEIKAHAKKIGLI